MYDFVKGERECIMPEISRSYHFGIGINTVYFLAEKWNLAMPLAKRDANYKFKNVDQLVLPIWKKEFRKRLSQAIPMRDNPCLKDFLKKVTQGSYIMFYNYSKAYEDSYMNFVYIASCFRAWVYKDNTIQSLFLNLHLIRHSIL